MFFKNWAISFFRNPCIALRLFFTTSNLLCIPLNNDLLLIANNFQIKLILIIHKSWVTNPQFPNPYKNIRQQKSKNPLICSENIIKKVKNSKLHTILIWNYSEICRATFFFRNFLSSSFFVMNEHRILQNIMYLIMLILWLSQSNQGKNEWRIRIRIKSL